MIGELCEEMDIRCRIELFGGVKIIRGGETCDKFRTNKVRHLLAYLALHPSHKETRERLHELFWPELEPDRKRSNLNTTVSSLRKMLEPTGTPKDSLLITNHTTVELSMRAISTDVDDFNALLQKVLRATDENEKAALRARAIELYKAPLLPEVYEDWGWNFQQTYEEKYAHELMQLVTFHQNHGNYQLALDYALRQYQSEYLDEDFCELVMQLFVKLGKTEEALKVYHDLLQVNDKPRNSIRILERQLHSTAHERTSLPQSSSIQVIHTEARSSVSDQLASIPKKEAEGIGWESLTAAQRLPLQLTRFFGRENELALLKSLIHQSARLITIWGTGGVGKTRLAIEVGLGCANIMHERIWFVPCLDLSDPQQLPERIAHVLELRLVENDRTLDLIARTLRGKPSLLVLDNFEHLLESGMENRRTDDAAGASRNVIQALLSAVPEMICLVTSRRPLTLHGENRIELAPLPVPQRDQSYLHPEELLEVPSIALYDDRSRRQKSDFALTENNAGVVIDLCRQLEGIPLAIEMAAARSNAMSTRKMLEALIQKKEHLHHRMGTVHPRHLSMHAMIAWSYDQLSPILKYWLIRLSVFRGGWDSEAARAIIGRNHRNLWDAQDILELLVHRSLITLRRDGDIVRFDMLKVVREYVADELFQSNKVMQIQNAHCQYYSDLVHKISPEFWGADQDQRFDDITREYSNIEAAFLFALQKDIVIGLRIASELGRYWQTRGPAKQGFQWLENAISMISDQEEIYLADAKLYASTLAPSSQLAKEYAKQSLDLYKRMDEKKGQTLALEQLGLIAQEAEELDDALDLYYHALVISEEIYDPQRIASCLQDLGKVAREKGDVVNARRYFERSLPLFRTIEDSWGEAWALEWLGAVCVDEEDYTSALDYYMKSLAICERLQIDLHIAAINILMGNLLYEMNQLDEAEMRYQYGLSLAKKQEDFHWIGDAIQGMATVAFERNHIETAQAHYLEALEAYAVVYMDQSSKRGIILSLLGMAGVLAAQGNYSYAAQLMGATDRLLSSLEEGARLKIMRISSHRIRQSQNLAHTRMKMSSVQFEKFRNKGRNLALQEILQTLITFTATDRRKSRKRAAKT